MITVSAVRMRHILKGDLTGGGHQHGAGRGRSEFPIGWDPQKIRGELLSVAGDPASTKTMQPNGKWRIEGERGVIRIRVVVDAASEVVTAHPC